MDPSPAHIPVGAFAGDGTVFLYSGRFHDGQTPHLITLGEELLRRGEQGQGRRNKLAFIMVEAFQNILRHRARRSDDERCLFVVRSRPGRVSVSAVNPMLPGEEPALDELLERIAEADAPMLKRMFLERLSDNVRSQRGGAGLGLIEMARRSGHGLRHRIANRADGTPLFFLEVVLGDVAEENAGQALDALEALYAGVERQRMIMHLRRPGSPVVLDAVQKMLTEDLDLDGRGDARRQAFLAAADLMGSMCEDGADVDRQGLSLAQGEGDLLLDLECALSTPRALELQAELDVLNGLDQVALRQRYRKAMLGEAKGVGSGGFAALDLARHAQDALALEVGEEKAGRTSVRLQAVI